jgi:hypothetical protein
MEAVVAEIARFYVTRKDVDLVLAELRNQRPTDVHYAALLAALLDAAARLATDASRLDTGHEQMTDLPPHCPRSTPSPFVSGCSAR